MHSRIRWQEQPTSYFPNVLCWDARVSLYEANNVTGSSPANRCLLWVDAVGGFLVCLSDQVILGQAVPGTTIDVPVLADLSRQHAMIERRGEQYLIHPIGLVTLRGQKLTDVGWLRDGDELEMGRGVRLRFRKPHPLSGTARLDFLSHHATQPSCDGVLLMANTCILGPQENHHVICRRWQGQVVLSRESGLDFRFRTAEQVEVDGKPATGSGILAKNSRLVGSDFTLSVEEL